MKNVNILDTDIAAINALSGVELTDFLTAGYPSRQKSVLQLYGLSSLQRPAIVRKDCRKKTLQRSWQLAT